MIHPSGARWGHSDWALCGALAGAVLVLTFSVWSILSGRYGASDPFIHVMIETISAMGAGAALSIVLGLVYRLLVRKP